MKKTFSDRIHYLLENNKSPSLKILVEKKQKFDDSMFDLPDDEDQTDEDQVELDDDGDEIDPVTKKKKKKKKKKTNDLEVDDEEAVTKSQLEDLQKDLNVIKNTILKTTSDDGITSVERFIANAVSNQTVSESYNKKSIKRFLFEDVDADEIEDDIETLDSVLSKGIDLVDKFKRGKDIDIESYVNAAINAYKNFDNLFSKEEIVKQASINVLVLNSGASAENHIKEFEELFHEELHKQFGVEYEEHALITKKFDVGSGARSQG